MADVTDPLPADRSGIDGADGLVLAAPGPLVPRVLDLTGLMTSVRVYSSVEEAAGVASPQRAARPVPRPDEQAIVAVLPTVRPGRQQEEGSVTPSSSPPRLTRGRIACDRTGRHLPGPGGLQGTW